MWCCSTYGRRTSFPKNKRGNDNLEQQAQALFDHYFDSGSIYLEDSIMGCLTDIAVYLNGLVMQKFRHSCISPWQYNHVIQRS